MKSICYFASYFTQKEVPYYALVYLHELKKHFSEVIFLTSQARLSEKSKTFFEENNIRVSLETNEGFDFGLWYKAMKRFNPEDYDQVALVNDSCILFKSLDEVMNWSRTNAADFQGITGSEAVSPHLQSYFLIINKKAIKHTKDYFAEHKLIHSISEVIKTYEVGLSKYLISKGMILSTFIDNQGYHGEFSPYYHCINYHLSKGIPLIKKKILFISYRKDELFTLARMNFILNPAHYIRMIKKYNTVLILDFDKLKPEPGKSLGAYSKIKYWLIRNALILIRPLNKVRKEVTSKV